MKEKIIKLSTTGMDPVNPKSVWELIQKLKKDRIIILTTHNMEEADITVKGQSGTHKIITKGRKKKKEERI
jgi:ABC-type multidrug transport system ATPase subunit